jgi:hypothetical protein
MASLHLKLPNERHVRFAWDFTDIPRFCGGDLFYDFSIETVTKSHPEEVDCKDAVKALAKRAWSNSLWMADRKGGPADKYIFSAVKEKTFFIKRNLICRTDDELEKGIEHAWYKCTVNLTPYFENENSGNEVRIFTMVLKRLKRKPKNAVEDV